MTKAKAAFDLGALDTIEACNKPAEIEIKHPVTGAPTGVFFSVLGKDSDTYRGRVRGLADQALRSQAMGKQAIETIDALEKKNIDALVAATVGWRTGDEPVVTLNGEKLEFNQANVRKVYQALLPVREQVAEALNNLGNFYAGLIAGFVEFAAFQFELAAEEEGGTVLEHLQAIERQTGVTPQVLLDAPPLPEGCEDLWRTFSELHDCRAWPYGPQRITYADIDAFQRVSGVQLQPWEREAIRRADQAYLEDWAARNKRDD